MLANTTENAANTAELQYVGFWPRFGAHMIDMILLGLIFNPLIGVTSYIGASVLEEEMAGVFFLSVMLVYMIIYFFILIAFWVKRQATPGKMLIAAKIVNVKTGLPPSLAQCIGRLFVYIALFTISGLLGFFVMSQGYSSPISSLIYVFLAYLLGGMGFLWIAFDKRKQGWHDKIARTIVIRDSVEFAKKEAKARRRWVLFSIVMLGLLTSISKELFMNSGGGAYGSLYIDFLGVMILVIVWHIGRDKSVVSVL